MGQLLSEIAMTLRLSKDAEMKLAQRAAATGKPLGEYISTLVESVVETPRTLAEISGPVYQRFLDSGTTDEELSEELSEEKKRGRSLLTATAAMIVVRTHTAKDPPVGWKDHIMC